MESNMPDGDNVVTEDRRTDISNRRTRVFPRRLTRKKPEELSIEERRSEDRRKGDRRSHKEEMT